jgi:processive rubber oxygenase RoxA-like protein
MPSMNLVQYSVPVITCTSRRFWRLLPPALIGVSALIVSMEPVGAQTKCAMRGDLAANSNVQWSALRAACEADQAAYKQKDPVGFDWFANAGNGFTGVPYIFQRILPDLAPEIWGRPEEAFARFGLFPDPNPNRPLPRGLGITSTAGRPVNANNDPTGEIDFAKPGLHVVTLACGACHTGQVRTGSGTKVFDGAPNTQMDVRKWREAYGLTVQNYLSSPDLIKSTAERIAKIIDSKPSGYFYPNAYFSGPGFLNFSPAVEAGQRAATKANLVAILSGFACGTADRATGLVLQTRTSYGNWNGPGLSGYSSGQQDGSGDLIFQLLVANAMPPGECEPGPGGTLVRKFDAQAFLAAPHPEIPPFATITDIPSVWNQQARDLAQWDGSVKMAFWRNIAAQLPIVGDPNKIDLQNTGIVANFLHGLPPAPYPFDVDMTRAVRGEALFKENCAACHKPLNNALYQYRDIGTDMNRAGVLNDSALKLFLAGFGASCHDPSFRYTPPGGQPMFPCKMSGDDVITGRITPSNEGYVTSVLDGIWARAPYLHNGSVPTLYHLLVPDQRPTQFLRASIDFDQRNVGYAWQLSETGRVVNSAPTLMIYDTSRDSHSNAGHDRDIVVDGKLRRLNWSGPQYAEQVRDLIEYLKTQ